MGEWIKKIDTHTMEYDSAFKKEILSHATTWMYPEDMVLSEIDPSQEDKYSMMPLL